MPTAPASATFGHGRFLASGARRAVHRRAENNTKDDAPLPPDTTEPAAAGPAVATEPSTTAATTTTPSARQRPRHCRAVACRDSPRTDDASVTLPAPPPLSPILLEAPLEQRKRRRLRRSPKGESGNDGDDDNDGDGDNDGDDDNDNAAWRNRSQRPLTRSARCAPIALAHGTLSMSSRSEGRCRGTRARSSESAPREERSISLELTNPVDTPATATRAATTGESVRKRQRRRRGARDAHERVADDEPYDDDGGGGGGGGDKSSRARRSTPSENNALVTPQPRTPGREPSAGASFLSPSLPYRPHPHVLCYTPVASATAAASALRTTPVCTRLHHSATRNDDAIDDNNVNDGGNDDHDDGSSANISYDKSGDSSGEKKKPCATRKRDESAARRTDGAKSPARPPAPLRRSHTYWASQDVSPAPPPPAEQQLQRLRGRRQGMHAGASAGSAASAPAAQMRATCYRRVFHSGDDAPPPPPPARQLRALGADDSLSRSPYSLTPHRLRRGRRLQAPTRTSRAHTDDAPSPPLPERRCARHGVRRMRDREVSRMPAYRFRRAAAHERFGHLRLEHEYDANALNSKFTLPFLRRRAKIVEIVASDDILFVLGSNGICTAYSRVTNRRLCCLNTASNEIIRSLFLNKTNDSIITVAVDEHDGFSTLRCRSTPFGLVRRGRPEAGFALFESESLMWPGFVEFDDVNAKVLTLSADRYVYKVWDLATYKQLYSISNQAIGEIKISPGLMLIIGTVSGAHVPLTVVNIDTGAKVREFAHLVRRGRLVQFIELFNNKLLVKQEGDNLRVTDLKTSRLIEVPNTRAYSPSSFIFLYENHLFLTFRNQQALVWDFDGNCVVPEFEDHQLWYPDPLGNNVFVTNSQDMLISFCAPTASTARAQSPSYGLHDGDAERDEAGGGRGLGGARAAGAVTDVAGSNGNNGGSGHVSDREPGRHEDDDDNDGDNDDDDDDDDGDEDDGDDIAPADWEGADADGAQHIAWTGQPPADDDDSGGGSGGGGGGDGDNANAMRGSRSVRGAPYSPRRDADAERVGANEGEARGAASRSQHEHAPPNGGAIHVSAIATGECVARIRAGANNSDERRALQDISAIFYNEERNEVYTGNRRGFVHVWSV